jgi:Tol biopolymer transport system component
LGITHRHLGPRNIVLDDRNGVKLVNFGLTPRRADPAFLAPEQLDGRGADARSDIYAFGLVLRAMLGTAAPKPLAAIVAGCIRRKVTARYQLMADVQAALEKCATDPAAHGAEPGRRMLLAIGGLVVVLAAGAWWVLGGRNATQQGPRPLTIGKGLTADAAISPDGRLVAYTSDRESPGVCNLFVQPLSGGPPTRLNTGPDDDRQPSFSADGEHIVFRSERDGGGLYQVSSAGGPLQLLAPGGREPRYSPDGRWIVYWTGDPLSAGEGAVWAIASSGGTPLRIRPEFVDARYPIWSPDGRNLLFVARGEGSRRGGNRDWYVAPFLEGSSQGNVIRTGAETLLRMQDLRDTPVAEVWAPGQILFSGRMTPMGRQSAGAPHLLRIPISADLMQATGAAHEITSGSDRDSHPRLGPDGRVAFTRSTSQGSLWSAAPDGSGELHRLAADAGAMRATVSGDGKRVAYHFHVSDGHDEIRVLDLDTGRQVAHVEAPLEGDNTPVISAAGDQVAYAAGGIYRLRLPDGKPERIPRRGARNLWSWSTDGKRMLVTHGWRSLGMLDTQTGEEREYLREDETATVEARFSPDDKWVAFTAGDWQNQRIYVVLTENPGKPWIEVTGPGANCNSPAWSADGSQIYFVTRCQGFRCIWARRFDARGKKAQGEAFPVRHFHHLRYALAAGNDPQGARLAVARDKLVFGISETTGNVWTLPSLPRP